VGGVNGQPDAGEETKRVFLTQAWLWLGLDVDRGRSIVSEIRAGLRG
jgi:hypothetical protein